MSINCDCILSGNVEVGFEGNLNADIVFVLESPGQTELNLRRPVVGKAGTRWEEELNNIGLNRSEVFVINSARCKVDKSYLKDSEVKQILKNCRPAMESVLKHINPKVIVACGGIAAHSLMGVPIKGIKKRRGNWDYSEEFQCHVLYTLHPSATLRNEGDLPKYKKDMLLLRKFIDNGFNHIAEDTHYEEVQTIRFLLDQKSITIGIDTETQGLRWYDDDFTIISYSVSDRPFYGYNIILWEEILPEGDEIPPHDKCILWERNGETTPVFLQKADNYDLKIMELKELLARKDIKKYTMTMYDIHVFEREGISEINAHNLDISIASHAIDSELYLNNSLEFLEQQLTTMDSSYNSEFNDNYTKEDMLRSLTENRDAFNEYSAADADGTLRVGLKLREELLKDKKTANYYINFVHPITSTVLYGLSKNGMLIDVNNLPKVKTDVIEEIEVCEKECIARIPKAVRDNHEGNLNLNRRKLISDTLFSEEGFGLNPIDFTAKTKEPKVDKNVLKRLKSSSKKQARDFIEWKEEREELHVLHSRYIKNIEQYMASDNRVHPSFSITFTSSGRSGCRQPNTMTIPVRSKRSKLIKKLFISRPGYKILHMDLSQGELRFIAHESKDPRMTEAFNNDEDLHLLTAIDMVERSGIVWDSLSEEDKKAYRQKAKPVNFGLPYRMSAKGLRDYAANDYGVHMSKKEAEERWRAWHRLYSGVGEWHDRCLHEMYSTGKVRTIFGRNRILRNLYSDNRRMREEAERIGINVKIQGPSSDYTLLGAHQMYECYLIDTEDIMLINFGHDSLTFEVKEDKTREYAIEIKNIMENVDTSIFGFKLRVPMKVDIEVGDNLHEKEELIL